jgi:hypothetical protein
MVRGCYSGLIHGLMAGCIEEQAPNLLAVVGTNTATVARWLKH